MDQIKKLYKPELDYLNDAIKDGGSPYHTFNLSTLNIKPSAYNTTV